MEQVEGEYLYEYRAPFAGKLWSSRVYSARCGICERVHELAEAPNDRPLLEIQLRRLIRREGWLKTEIVGWVCPGCAATFSGP